MVLSMFEQINKIMFMYFKLFIFYVATNSLIPFREHSYLFIITGSGCVLAVNRIFLSLRSSSNLRKI